MNLSVKRSVQIAALTAMFSASGAGIALAGTGPHTSGNQSILGGNQISLPISIPVNLCGNAVALLGDAFAGCQGGASVSGGSGGGASTTSGNHSIGGGNQASAPISVPVNVCGNSVAVLGNAKSGCKGGASTSGGGSGGGSTSGNGSAGGGNQVGVPIKVPVNVCGISVGILGDAASSCQGGAHTSPPPGHHHHHHHTPPPAHHHHHHKTPPPARHHHHGGSGATVTSTPPSSSTGGSLPTTGANFLGLLALAGGATVIGAGSTILAKCGLLRGVLAITRRAATVMAR
jgi:ChpA-C